MTDFEKALEAELNEANTAHDVLIDVLDEIYKAWDREHTEESMLSALEKIIELSKASVYGKRESEKA